MYLSEAQVMSHKLLIKRLMIQVVASHKHAICVIFYLHLPNSLHQNLSSLLFHHQIIVQMAIQPNVVLLCL